MGLLEALGLPPLKTPAAAPGRPGPARGARPTAANGRLVGPVVGNDNRPSFPVGPVVDGANLPAPRPRTQTISRIDRAAEAAAKLPAADPARAAPTSKSGLPSTREVGYGDFSLGLKDSDDGQSLIVKFERKQNVGRQNFKVWVVPCYVKADLKLGIEGEVSLADAAKRSLKVSAAGSVEVGVLGYTSEVITVGPNGAPSSRRAPVSRPGGTRRASSRSSLS